MAGNNNLSKVASSNKEALSTTQYNNLNNSNSHNVNEDTLAYVASNQTGVAMTNSDQNKISLNDSNSQITIQRNFDYKDTTLVMSHKSGTVEMTKKGKSNQEFKEYNQSYIGAMETSEERSETLAEFSQRLPHSKAGNGEPNDYDQSV